uniref:hypothetical protein n=1 Tax=Candidatus Electronema sp. TaxID=2698783 RepID=UPI004055F8BD
MTHLKTTDWFCFTLRCSCGSGTICSAAPAAAGKIYADAHQTFFLYNEEAALSSGRMHHSTFIFPEITSYYSTCWVK